MHTTAPSGVAMLVRGVRAAWARSNAVAAQETTAVPASSSNGPYGTTRHGKQRYRCRTCPDHGRPFLLEYTYAGQSPDVKNLRTRIKRLVRRTICFSKTTTMHDLVLGLFINRYEFGVVI